MIIDAFGVSDEARTNAWRLDRCEFRPRLNLIVGASGAGKTKLLGGLFNVARLVASDTVAGPCTAFVEFSLDGERYRWDLKIERPGPSPPVIAAEKLVALGGRTILERVGAETMLEGVKMPKLPSSSTALRVLREEDVIQPIARGFSSIRRRQFQGAELDIARGLQQVPREVIEHCKTARDPSVLYWHQLSVSAAAKVLKDHFPETYRSCIQYFKDVFRTVEDVRLGDAQALDVGLSGSAPVLMLKEKGIADSVPIPEWSSGMVKVLLLILDVLTQPKHSIYMIDEYENSLGVNAIDFFPSFAREVGGDIQFFITSHHPLLINAVPISDWIVLGRNGSHVQAMYGDRLKERYGLSHHEQYVQLLNDPFYQRGER